MEFYQDSRSVGAIAGFAVAIIFTWRLLRSSNGHQRQQPKRQMPAPSSSASNAGLNTNEQSIPSGVCSPSEDLRAHNVVDEFFQPVKVRAQITAYILSCIFNFIPFAWHTFKIFYSYLFLVANSGSDCEAKIEWRKKGNHYILGRNINIQHRMR